jgi:heme A synthase
MSLYRFAAATAVATFVLLLVGGTVNPTGSSLACPDWPTCYGSFFPEMKNGVEYEHTHRLVATVVGLMTCILAVWIWRARKKDRRLVRLGFLAVGLVVAQGVLGGITVLLKLPLLVSVGHLALSMVFFLLLIYLAYELKPGRAASAGGSLVGGQRSMVLLATLGVYAQVLLGAFVRHSRSGRACNDDFLLCAGKLWPSWGPAQLHMVHRFVALIVLALVVAAAVSGARAALRRPLARSAALAALFLAVLQIVMGLLLVRSSIGLAEAVAHTGVAALLLGSLALAYLALDPEPQPATDRAHAEQALSARS